MNRKTVSQGVILLLFLTNFAAAQDNPITDAVCTILLAVGDVLTTIAPTLVLLMFTYGGVKYIFSADDPGGRKQGKNICIHAIIGGVIVFIASAVVDMIFTDWASCVT